MALSDYAIKRALLTIPVLIGISVLVFFLMKITPGDPVTSILPPQARTPENVEFVRERYNLNEPLYMQYYKWLTNAVTGDLGRSFMLEAPVASLLWQRIWPTTQLAIVAFLVSVLVAIPLGLISAVYQDSWIDHASRVMAFSGISMPPFWTGILVILIFALFWNQWFGSTLVPPGGYVAPSENIIDWFQHVIAPGITLGIGYAALTTRLTRSAMVEVLNEDYIRTARAKGVKEKIVVMVHAFRNALIPVVTVMGLQIGFLFNGAVVVEQVFQWPGIGRLLYQAVTTRDMPLLQGVVMFVAIIFVCANLAVDLLYAYLDPRIKYE